MYLVYVYSIYIYRERATQTHAIITYTASVSVVETLIYAMHPPLTTRPCTGIVYCYLHLRLGEPAAQLGHGEAELGEVNLAVVIQVDPLQPLVQGGELTAPGEVGEHLRVIHGFLRVLHDT